MTLTPAVNHPRRLLLAGGDLGLFLAFAAIGRRAHAAASPLDDVVQIALPFVVGWAIVAPFTGAYQREATESPTAGATVAARTWLLAFPLGLALRALMLGRWSHISFALVAGAFTLVTLAGWRALAGRGG